MLRSEETGNNEQDESPTLLQVGKNMRLSLTNEEKPFQMSESDVKKAFSQHLYMFEEQGLSYFSGYVLSKTLCFHQECSVCSSSAVKITSKTTEVPQHAFFTWLKKYEDDVSTLYSPTEDFLEFARKMSLLVHYGIDNYLGHPKILKSLQEAVEKNIDAGNVKFCSEKLFNNCVSRFVRTIFHFKLKWLNGEMMEESLAKKHQRKKKILLHM